MRPAERPEDTQVRWLSPEDTHVFEGTYSLLHCSVKGDTLYRGVFAVRMFPVSHPDRYISLRYHDRDEKVREVGVILDLKQFPEAARQLVRASLDRHYHERVITHVHRVRNESGILVFDVATERGREQFMMPWRHDRAENYSERGKLLLDAADNRFIVPDVMALPVADRRRLTKYIYW